jgi:hypothetical protein
VVGCVQRQTSRTVPKRSNPRAPLGGGQLEAHPRMRRRDQPLARSQQSRYAIALGWVAKDNVTRNMMAMKGSFGQVR